MSDMSKDFRSLLKEKAAISDVTVKQKLVSSDGTIKYLLEFEDGNCAETVLMRFDDRKNLSVCVSSQVGCSVGCVFCATGKQNFKRNLSYKEIVEQILTIQRDINEKVTNVVYMGQGEPFLNYANVMKSIDMLNKGLDIGARRITISTSGIIPQIYKLVQEEKQVILALSLHAPSHELRKRIMPIEESYPIDQLIQAMRDFVTQTGRRVTIEYVLIKDFNDKIEHAGQLNKLLKGLKCNINLIPYNPFDNDEYQRPSREKIDKFKAVLEQSGKKVTVRLERGVDILAACGQLAGKG
jgi:23S rRNA (adenine2503-C2)-methyltransferase